MSNPLKENQDGGGEAMDSAEDHSPGSSAAAAPAATTAGTGELGEEQTSPAPINGSLSNRYRQILQEQRDQLSDSSSVDNAPRRAASPIGSALSVPDDAASAQVWATAHPSEELKTY